jgi:hypothetical protein
MNTILVLLSVLVGYVEKTPSMPIDDALTQRKISVSARAADNSTHYQQPVVLEIRNISGSPVAVDIPVGRLFASHDTTEQNFVSTEPLLADLAPGESRTYPISAMCINHHKAAPSGKNPYHMKKSAEGHLLKTARFIHEKKLSGSYLGQTAVWCISDREPLENIFGFDERAVGETAAFLAQLTGRPLPPAPAKEDYMRNPRATPKRSVGGEFEFRFSQTKAVHIALFNAEDIAVRELYNNPAEQPGNKKITFEFDFSVYNQGPYSIRFLADNRILMEQDIRF